MKRGVLADLKSHFENDVQKLRIPLKSPQNTTRRLRRVVWISVITLHIFILSYCLTFWWLTNPSGSIPIPKETSLMIKFSPNRYNWPIIKKALHNIPLISEKSLTINDIEDLRPSQLNIFVNNEGGLSLSMRLKDDNWPRQLYENQGISITDAENGYVLLDNQIRPFSRVGLNRNWYWPDWPLFAKQFFLGEICSLNSQKCSAIRGSETGLDIKLKNKQSTNFLKEPVPENIVVFLSTLLWTERINHDFPWIEAFLGEFNQELAEYTDFFQKNLSFIVLTENSDGHSFLLTSKDPNNRPLSYGSAIKYSVAFSNPKIYPLRMPDDTEMQEIRIEPKEVFFLEQTLKGTIWSRAYAKPDDYLMAGYVNSETVITDNQELAEFWLGTKSDRNLIDPLCGGKAGFINLNKFLHLSGSNLRTKSSNIIFPLAKNFPHIGIQNQISGTHLLLCF